MEEAILMKPCTDALYYMKEDNTSMKMFQGRLLIKFDRISRY